MKSRFFLTASILALLAGLLLPAGVADQAQASSPFGPPWYVRGDFNGWADPGELMYDDGTHGDAVSGDLIFTILYTVATAGRYEWKVTDGSNWYPPSNAWAFTAAAGQPVKFTFDSNTHSDGWSPSQNIANVQDNVSTWTAIGDWQGWGNGNPATAMHAYPGGLYAHTGVIATAGTHQYKVCRTGTWDCIGPEGASGGRSINTANLDFTTVIANQRVLFLANPTTGRIRAEALGVMLNEFVAKGTEWVELYNPLTVPVPLVDWTLRSASAGLIYTFPSTATISAGGFFTRTTGATLNNDGDIITLTNAAGFAVDRVGFGTRGAAPIPPQYFSTARTPNGHDTDDDARDWNMDETETPGAANDVAGVNLGSTVILNEFDNYPSAGNDKVEVYNPTGASVDLNGWLLSDGDARGPIVTHVSVPPYGWAVMEETVDWTVSMDFSSADVAYLFLPDGTRVEQIGWYNEFEDGTFQRICDGEGPNDGYNWVSSGGGRTWFDLPSTVGSSNCAPLSVDAAVVKDGPATVLAGGPITYTLSYSLTTVRRSDSFTISDTLPAEVTFVTFTSLLPITWTGSVSPVVFLAGTLYGLQHNVITVVGDVAAGLPLGTRLTNTVDITCPGDSNPNNNRDSFTSLVVGSEAAIAKVGPSMVLPGDPIVYTLTYSVQGDDAQNLVITDVLPLDVGYVDDTAPVTPSNPAPSTYVWELGTVAEPGGSFVIHGTVSGNPATRPLHNQVWVSATNDTLPDNNYASWDTDLPVPIYDIQYVPDPLNDDASPYNGLTVWTVGVVVARYTGSIKGYALADPQTYGPWEGLFVYDPGRVVTEGQRLLLRGTVSEYPGNPGLNLTELGDIEALQVLDQAWPMPDAVVTTTATISTVNPQTAEPLESVLVEVRCAEVTRLPNDFGEWLVTDASGVAAQVDDMATYAYTPTLGDILDVRGILYFAYGHYKIEPRGDADIAPAVGVVATGPADGAIDVAVNANVTATFNAALDPATVSTATFFLEGPGGVQVPGTVTYDAGTWTATFDPAADLAYAATYVAHLTTDIHGEQGAALCAEYSWSFATAAVPGPDLGNSEKRVDRPQVQAGDTLTYTLRLLNSGEITAAARLTDVVPAEVTVLTPTLPPGMVYDNGLLLWSGEVYPNQPPLLLAFQAQVSPTVPTGTTIVNVVWIDDGVHLFTKTASVEVTDAPDIVVSPLVLSAILQPGQGTSRNLLVQNAGLAELFWLLSQVPPAAWLSADPTSGQIPAGGQEVVAVTFDATGLPVGSYTTTLDVNSTDPDEPHIYVGVTLVVTTSCIPASDPQFDWTPLTPTAGQPATFNGSASGLEPITYTWAFGDGGTGAGASIQHTYALSGTFTAVMTATNACGAASITHAVHVVGLPQLVWKVYLPVVLKSGAR